MLSKFTFFIFSVIIASCAYSQDYWEVVALADTIEPYELFLTSEGDLLLGSNNGVYKSTDDGFTWEHLGNMTYSIYDLVQASNGDLYASAGAGILKSSNGGQSWYTVSVGIDVVSLFCSSQDYLFRGFSGGISKSVDSGYTWNNVHQTTEVQVFYDFAEKGNSLFSGSVDYMFYDDGIYKSTNEGDDWYLCGLNEHGVKSLAFDIDSNLLAGVGAAWPGGSLPGLFRSYDEGISWENIYYEEEVESILVDLFGGIYIGLKSDLSIVWGVRYSSDNGQTWEDISSGIQQPTYVKDLAINSNNYLFAICSSPRILYRSINPIVGVDESFKQNVPYIIINPNPFYSTIQLTLIGKIKSPVKIDVYNTFGNLIKQLEVKNHNMNIELKSYPPGIYIIKIYNHNFHSTRKVIKSY